MKFRILYVFLAIGFLVSCQNEDAQRLAAAKDAKKKELIFANVEKGWNLSNPPIGSKSLELVRNWEELRLFATELYQKPKSSIGAFQKKAKELSKKAADLNKNIPTKFNKPEIKARIAVLITKVNSINLFINLQEIPDQKIVLLVADINTEMASLYRQMDEIVRKSEIPKEEGEADMIRMLDTARAIQTTPKP